MATDDLGNQFVDYVWGNMAPQPDEGRPEEAPLDPAQGFHSMLINAYNGFPGYSPVAPYLDEIPNVSVPDVVDNPAGDAQSAIEGGGLVYAEGAVVGNAGGATLVNDGNVASQSPAAGTMVNDGDTVTVRVYEFTPVVPGAPTSLAATPGVLRISVAFTAPTSDGGSEITNYEYTLNDGVTWTAFDPAETTSPVIIEPLPAVETTVKLRAVNAVGAGPASAAVTATPSAE